MGGLIEFYLLFCLTTALAYLFTTINPLVSSLSKVYPKPKVLKESSQSFLKFVLFILVFVLAPIMLIIYLIPSHLARFTERIFEELSKEE